MPLDIIRKARLIAVKSIPRLDGSVRVPSTIHSLKIGVINGEVEIVRRELI
jgi:hypothetical protein